MAVSRTNTPCAADALPTATTNRWLRPRVSNGPRPLWIPIMLGVVLLALIIGGALTIVIVIVMTTPTPPHRPPKRPLWSGSSSMECGFRISHGSVIFLMRISWRVRERGKPRLMTSAERSRRSARSPACAFLHLAGTRLPAGSSFPGIRHPSGRGLANARLPSAATCRNPLEVRELAHRPAPARTAAGTGRRTVRGRHCS